MKFIKEANKAGAALLGSVGETANIIHDVASAARIHTKEWKDTAHDQVQLAKLKNGKRFMKSMDKLMDNIDADMLTQREDGMLVLDKGKVLEAYKARQAK